MWTACRHQNRRFGAPATETSIFAHASALSPPHFFNPEVLASSVLCTSIRITKNDRHPAPLPPPSLSPPCRSVSANTHTHAKQSNHVVLEDVETSDPPIFRPLIPRYLDTSIPMEMGFPQLNVITARTYFQLVPITTVANCGSEIIFMNL